MRDDRIYLDWKKTEDGDLVVYEPATGRLVALMTAARVDDDHERVQSVTVTFLPYPLRKGTGEHSQSATYTGTDAA